MNELPAPPEAAQDPNSLEIVRGWLIEGTLQCSFVADIFEEPAHWGSFLADLARHVARALHDQAPQQQLETLTRIRDAFVIELSRGAEADDPGSPE